MLTNHAFMSPTLICTRSVMMLLIVRWIDEIDRETCCALKMTALEDSGMVSVSAPDWCHDVWLVGLRSADGCGRARSQSRVLRLTRSRDAVFDGTESMRLMIWNRTMMYSKYVLLAQPLRLDVELRCSYHFDAATQMPI